MTRDDALGSCSYYRDRVRIAAQSPTLIPLLIALLPLPRVPAQLSTDTVDPILTSPALWHDIRKRISACTYRNIVAWTQLDSLPAIKAGPATGSGIVRYTNSKNDSVR